MTVPNLGPKLGNAAKKPPKPQLRSTCRRVRPWLASTPLDSRRQPPSASAPITCSRTLLSVNPGARRPATPQLRPRRLRGRSKRRAQLGAGTPKRAAATARTTCSSLTTPDRALFDAYVARHRAPLAGTCIRIVTEPVEMIRGTYISPTGCPQRQQTDSRGRSGRVVLRGRPRPHQVSRPGRRRRLHQAP